MKQLAIGVLLLLLCIGLAPADSESVGTKPGRRATLELHQQTPISDNWEKATISFRPEEIYAGSREPQNEWDLLYGGLNYNGDRDWLKVNCGRQSWSRIRDLGELDWSDDIDVPVLPILPCRTNQPCGRIHIPPPQSEKKIQNEDLNPHIAKPIVGHMYVVHRHREKRNSDPPAPGALFDYYALIRVEELKPNESCTITWKRISAPKANHVQDAPPLNQVILFSKIAHRDWSRSSINFDSGERGSPTADTSPFDLIYGTLAVNDDSNWFEVVNGRSMIVDLGVKQWSDFKETPSFPNSNKPRKPPPLSGRVKEIDASAGSKEISPYQQFVPVKGGHMYLMKVVREGKKIHVMFRVDALVSEDNCHLSWKKVTPPREDIEGPRN